MSKETLLSEELLSAETGVLGSMLIDESAIGKTLLALEETDFQTPERRHIFQAIRRRFSAGLPVDPILINEDLGGIYGQLMADMIDRTPTAANAEAYAAALKRASRLWQLRQIGEQLTQAESEEDCQKLIDQANILFSQRAGIRRLNMDRGFREFFKRHSQHTPPDHIRWGLGSLDEELHVGAGDMVVIGGYPSAGKTALALQLAFHIAKSKRVGFFSYETAADKLYDRTVACQTQTSFRRMTTGTLVREDYGRVKDMRQYLTAPTMDLLEASGMTVSTIGSYAMAHHYDVVLVDYLQKISSMWPGRYQSDFERVSQVSNDLQQLGRTTGKVVIALSQLSRAERGRNGESAKAPTMSSLRQSGQIEQDADVVMLLYKEFPDAPNSRRLLDVAKNKDGESGLHMMLEFDGDNQRFRRSIAQPIPQPTAEPPAQQSVFRPLPDNTPMPFDDAGKSGDERR